MLRKDWGAAMTAYRKCKSLENCSQKTLDNYERCIEKLCERVNKPLKKVTGDDLRDFLTYYREERGVSLAYLDTIRHYLSAWFGWCSDEGYILKNPVRRIPRIKVPKKIKKALTAEEREKLKDNAGNARDLALMELLYSTAARVNEVLALNISDVNFDSREVLLYDEKGKRERIVYLSDTAVYYLRKYLASRGDDNPALFVTAKAPHTRLKAGGVQKMLRDLGRSCGVEVHPHKFRRSFLTDASSKGMSLQELQTYAGHVKPETTMNYIEVKQEDIRATFRRLS